MTRSVFGEGTYDELGGHIARGWAGVCGEVGDRVHGGLLESERRSGGAVALASSR